jgi:rhodanese-related sulfurtransferase
VSGPVRLGLGPNRGQFALLGCLTPAQLRRRQAARERLTLLDVRSAGEFARAHVEEAINIPLPRLEKELERLDRAVPVVTICGKGAGRSDTAARLLRERGFRDVRSLCGGTEAPRSVA